MKCSLCHNKTTQKTKCLLCLDYFCSYKCMESHITLFHNKKFEQNIVRSDNNSNNININNNIINTQLYQEEKNNTDKHNKSNKSDKENNENNENNKIIIDIEPELKTESISNKNKSKKNGIAHSQII